MRVRTFKSVTKLSESAKSSRPGGDGLRVFPGVTLIKAGLGNRRDRNYYLPETLETAVREGRFEGLRAFVDHPDSVSEEIHPERTVRDLAGLYENARYNPRRRTVEADLRILKSHQWLADTIDELIGIGHADKIGLSINGRGRTEPARRRLEEAGGEEVDVNEVKEFLELRSTDIVTEAGAGGGFTQLLESARKARENTPMAKTAAARALRALREGKHEDAERILAEAAAPAKGMFAGKRAAESDDDGDDGALEEASDDIKAAAVEELEAGDDVGDNDGINDADGEPEDEAEDGDDEDDEDGDEDGDAVEESEDASARAQSAAARVRAQATRTQEARKLIRGGTGTTGTVKSHKGSFTKKERAPKKKSRVPMALKKMSGKRTTPGATREADYSGDNRTSLLRENAALRQTNRNLAEKNERLAEALLTHRTADRARTLLESSDIPKGLRPSMLKHMVRMNEAEMRGYIADEVERIRVIAESVGEQVVTGAGTSLRESWGADESRNATGVLSQFGIPTRK